MVLHWSSYFEFRFLWYLNLTFHQFAPSLSSESILMSYTEPLLVPAWKQAINEEIDALASWETWKLILAPTYAIVMGCRWVYTLKFRPDGSMDRYKTRLVAKGYTQTYSINYFETFSLIARMNSISILFSVFVNLSCPLFQLDVKNAFLYGDLQVEVYMGQPLGYVTRRE